MDSQDDPYLCVGVCMADPDSGYCLGCGRPPAAMPEVVCEPVTPVPDPLPKTADPDTPA